MMDRRLIAGLLGLYVAGCAQARSGMPEVGNHEPAAQVDSLPPIQESINRTSPPVDSATRRAVHDPATLNPPRNSGEAPAGAAIPAGRPAPFSDRTEGKARLQAPPASGRPEDRPPDARPAPYADRAPAGPRPIAPTPAPSPAPAPAPTTSANLPAIAPLLPAISAPPAVAVAAEPSTRDTAVVPTSAVQPPPKPRAEPATRIGGGGQAATVGSEVITLDQLRLAVGDLKERIPPEEWERPEVKYDVTRTTLNRLVSRTLIIQAVKKQIKDPKALQSVYDSIDKGWVDQELPPLLRKTGAANIHELKRKYAEHGKSLDAIREDFRFEQLAHEYMLSKIQTKMQASFPEKQRYYTAHVKDFDRPAQVVWREIVIENAKCSGRAEAKAKADAIFGRVKKGEDFAKIARAESHGATAREGGLWEIAPGGYGVPEINAVIDALAPGRTSGVIEAPGGFHIVRVESKREAGPARFDEVQDEIKELILREKFGRLSEGFITNLKANTIVTTMFDAPEVDPAAVRTSAEAAPEPPTTR